MSNKLLFLPLLFTAAACGGDKKPGGTNPPPPPPPSSACANTGTLTVCDLKLDGGDNQPVLDDPIVLENVVVTTPLYSILENMQGETTLGGFFVQDQNSPAELGGRYSGVLVAYYPASVQGDLPALGDVITVQGLYKQFGQTGYPAQKQVEATFIESKGMNIQVTPIAVDGAGKIGTGGELAAAYEGVVVTVQNLTATTVRDVPGSNGNSIFGAFMVNDSLVISGEIFQYRAIASETFNSITGVLRIGTAPFDAGISLLTPRNAADVSPTNPVPLINSIATIQNPSAPGRPEICYRDNTTNNMTVGRCPKVEVEGAVVTAAGGFVSTNLRSVWLQDPSITDGRFAGVKVVYFSNTTDYVPAVGHRVKLKGEAISWFKGMQVQNATFERMGTGTSSVAATVVQPSAIARTESPDTNPYEGVLVRIENVSVTQACVESNNRDFGNWEVTGPVYLGTAFSYVYNGGFGPSTTACMTQDCSCAGMSRPDDLRNTGDQFRSITGVMNYAFDEYRLEPRGAADLVRN